MNKKINPLACIILAAGRGTRMKSSKPKVLHEIAGRPMLAHLLETVEHIGADKIIIVTAPDMDDVRHSANGHTIAIQDKPLGTGDAVAAALPALDGFDGDVLVLLGDMPLLSAETLTQLIATKHENAANDLSVLGVNLSPTPAFGRLITAEDGHLAHIVEDKDCTAEQRAVTLCNTGAFCLSADGLRTWIPQIKNANAQQEYYFTDIPAIAAKDDAKTHIHITDNTTEVKGVNSRQDLAVLEAAVQNQLRQNAMNAGATLIDPSSVTLCHDTVIGQDTIIEPNVVFGKNVILDHDVHIKAFSHMEGAHVKSGAVIGPFARLRPGSDIGENVKIGNFVEVKNATLHEGVKAGHLAYIGDAEIGAGTNYSCGAITANYDGFNKHKTIIGENVMIGSNVNLIAPVTIADGAYIAAGSTISSAVEKDALAITRTKPKIIEGWAARNRKKNEKRAK